MAIFAPLFDTLNTAGIRYVVVGGLATVLHGYARLTVDIDLMVDLAPEQAEKVISTLTTLGLVPQLPSILLTSPIPTPAKCGIQKRICKCFR